MSQMADRLDPWSPCQLINWTSNSIYSPRALRIFFFSKLAFDSIWGEKLYFISPLFFSLFLKDYFGEVVSGTNACRVMAFTIAQRMDDVTNNNDWNVYKDWDAPLRWVNAAVTYCRPRTVPSPLVRQF